MEVDHQMMLRCSLGHALVEIDHPLVAMVHKINFHAGHTPVAELFEEVGMVLDALPGEPEEYAYALALAVVYHLFQIEIVIGSKGIGGVLRPAFVQQNIFYTEFRSEIYIIFICIGVAAGLEFHIRSVGNVAIPPVPRYFARTYPRGCSNGAGLSELLRLVLCQYLLGIAHNEIPPGKSPVAVSLCDVVGLLRDFQTTVAIVIPFEHCLGEGACDAFLTADVAALVEHARIVEYGGLGYQHIDIAAVLAAQQQGSGSHFALAHPLGGVHMQISLFVGCTESSGFLHVSGEGGEGLEAESLVLHLYITLGAADKPVCHCIVGQSDLKHEVAFEPQQHLGIRVLRVFLAESACRNGLFHGALLAGDDGAQSFGVVSLDVQPQVVDGEQRLPFISGREVDGLVVIFHGQRQTAIGG